MAEIDEYSKNVIKILQINGIIERLSCLITQTTHFYVNSIEMLNEDGIRVVDETANELAKVVSEQLKNRPSLFVILALAQILVDLGNESVEGLTRLLREEIIKELGVDVPFQIERREL